MILQTPDPQDQMSSPPFYGRSCCSMFVFAPNYYALFMFLFCIYLRKLVSNTTERAIKNEQSRETGKIGNTRKKDKNNNNMC
jgi:hypothetical protein